jgi:hypothetical protein
MKFCTSWACKWAKQNGLTSEVVKNNDNMDQPGVDNQMSPKKSYRLKMETNNDSDNSETMRVPDEVLHCTLFCEALDSNAQHHIGRLQMNRER